MWSSLTFGVTVMLGAFAGKIMKEGKANRKRVVQTLLVVGLALVGLALLWSLQMPVIKRIWTGSMTLLSGGYCFLLMALFYYWIDYKGIYPGIELAESVWHEFHYGVSAGRSCEFPLRCRFGQLRARTISGWLLLRMAYLRQLSDCLSPVEGDV